ncbi:mechanosensitive ion channel family protein [Thermosphaera aggregans]|jgi:small-conductance mechanosensitive channel|uniref:MscS Mechanosensitive ion channel n=1 Tax=Thermosphaera aggregans (strain DSM 11486 / M11TL) TaxID=633148 RepID=D5U3G9_THEAM|nr:mechanosensitive ion channel family protein [Thermosphaera aggregans]ADG91669.1 MscS Mechanosensitive ion channel [Thermosphaera aggregans DSM 11486]
MSLLEPVLGFLNNPQLLSIIIALIIFSIGYFVALVIRRIVFKIGIRFYARNIASIVSKIIYYVVLLIALSTALGYLGVELTGLIIAGGFAGIIVGVALQPLMASFFAGLYVMAERVIQQGEVVSIGNTMGEVVEVSLMFTKIRTFDGVLVTMPNSQLLSTVIQNYSKAVARMLEFTVSIAYSEDAEKAYSVIKDAVDNHPYVLADPAPDIFVSKLGDSGVVITVRVWVPRTLVYPVTKDLLWKIKKSLDQAGVSIPFPQLDVWIKTPVTLKKEEGSG